jgi:hypothetical protein
MTDLRDAARQALKSLRGYRREIGCDQPCDAERALEAALEQPEQGPLCKGIPRRGCNYLAACDTACNKCGKVHAHHQMIAQFHAAQQPEQEPVATVAMDVSGAHLSWDGQYLGQRPDMKIAMLLKDLPVGTLLYAHPPRREWQGLTEEEIYPLYSEPSSDAEMVEFARAIEAALRSKNYE